MKKRQQTTKEVTQPSKSQLPSQRRHCVREEDSHLSLVHLMVGVGSPTELQGSRTSFIQGVVTVPPNERIFAGAVSGTSGTGGGRKKKTARPVGPVINTATRREATMRPRQNHKSVDACHS